MLLREKFYLCYVNANDLFAWVKEKNVAEKDFLVEKAKWERVMAQEPSFFSDTELLVVDGDIVLLKTVDDQHSSFLARIYKLEYQAICQKFFSVKKNIIIISAQQWKEPKDTDKLVVLFKDRASIEKAEYL